MPATYIKEYVHEISRTDPNRMGQRQPVIKVKMQELSSQPISSEHVGPKVLQNWRM